MNPVVNERMARKEWKMGFGLLSLWVVLVDGRCSSLPYSD